MGIIHAFRRWLGLLWWIFPVVLVAGGYLVAALRLPVSSYPIPEDMKASLYFWLLVSVVLCGIWIVAAFFHASNHTTSVAALKTHVFVSVLLSVCLAATTAYLAGQSQLVWALVLPTCAAVIDALVTSDRAINNAAQKPIVHHKSIGA